MTEEQVRQLNATGAERLAKRHNIPLAVAQQYIRTAMTAFVRRDDAATYREATKEGMNR
jgi:hypothetical protein